LVLLYRAGCAWLISVVDFFLCLSCHDGALPFVPSSTGFSRGDLFWLLPRCFVRCGVGRGVARRSWFVAAGGGTAGSWLHREACAWLRSVGCEFVVLCLLVVVFFLCMSRHNGALPYVPSLSGFSRGDLFWMLPRCVVRCGIGRGVLRRAWCVAAGGGTAGILVASCSGCAAYKCWLRVCRSALVWCCLLSLPVASLWRPT
jgi:hypothetical protein